MPLTEQERTKLQGAINQLRADINDLEVEIPRWDNQNISGTKRYRPIAEQITESAKRLAALVKQHTF
jgi:hypothetical protein